MMTSPDFRLGDRHPSIALLGACPGKDEALHGRPFCGEAGSFLQVMMAEISKLCPQHFPSEERDDYTLLNAHHEARHAETSHKENEPSKPEVEEPANIARLQGQVHSISCTTVLCIGGAAQYAVPLLQEVRPQIVFFACGHPSRQAWNTRVKGNGDEEKARRWAAQTFRPL